MENKLLIDHFQIFALGQRLSFISSEPIFKVIRMALITDSDYIQDIQVYFGAYPTVKTTIYYKQKANIDNFLEIGSVRKIFEDELRQKDCRSNESGIASSCLLAMTDDARNDGLKDIPTMTEDDALLDDSMRNKMEIPYVKFSGQEAPECDETLLFNRTVQPEISIIRQKESGGVIEGEKNK